VRLSQAPSQRADGSSRKVSQLSIFLGDRPNRHSRCQTTSLAADVANEPLVKAGCIVAENIRLSRIRVNRSSSFRFHTNLSNRG
jgi:hypothetical protein